MLKFFQRFKTEKYGQEMVEWWFIISVVAVVVMYALLRWGVITTDIIQKLTNALGTINNGF